MAEHSIPRDVHITYVDIEGPLIKIYAQTDKENAKYIEKLLYQLREVLEIADTTPKLMNDVKVGLICCAKFEDGVYYRARIVSLERLSNHLITVLFIDHGNVADVNVAEIRLLKKLKTVLHDDNRISYLMEVTDLAQEFYLGGVAPISNNQWDRETLEILRKAICNTDGKATVHEVGDKKILNFRTPDVDPAKLLISWNKGLPLSLQHLEEYLRKTAPAKAKIAKSQMSLPQRVNTSLPPPNLPPSQPIPFSTRLPNLSQPPPVRVQSDVSFRTVPIQPVMTRPARPPGMQVRRPDTSISMPASNLQFSTEMLTPGVTHRVYVSHVEDGPHSFAVQLQTVVDEVLSRMMLDLNNIEPLPITAPLNPGSICIGRYSGDNTLCRAIVMNVMDDKVKLYFADFGSSEVVPYSMIYQIPAQFVTPKVMSHRFTLANIKDVVYSDQEKKLFKNLVANERDLMLTVTPPEANPLKQYCELFLHCKNVKTIMAEMSQAQQHYLRYPPISAPLKGSQEKVFVSYVLNPGRFFVQLDKNDYSLKQVMRYVAEHCTKAPHVPLSNQRPGEPCCALFEDGIWYRAEIIKLSTNNKAFINFVDFGNEEEISLTNLRQISPELVMSLKAQAVLCCLSGYENRYDVDEEISNRLEELILEQKVMMHVEESVELPGQITKLIVSLLDGKGADIGSQLEVKQAPAKPVYSSPPTNTEQNNGWEEKQSATVQNNNSWGQHDSRGQSDERKTWRSKEEDDTGSKFNREGSKRYNRDDRSEEGGRYNKDRGSGGKFGDEERSGKFNREDGGGRFTSDSDSRGVRSNDDKSTWRNNEDSGGWKPRGDREGGGGYKSREEGSGGGWRSREGGNSGFKPKEEGGGDGWKSREDGGSGGWKSREDGGSGGGWKSREGGGGWKPREDGGSSGWKSREGGGGGWKSREDGGGGGWKPREDGGGGGWKPREDGGGGGWKPREDGGGGGWKPREDGGERRNRFDGERRGGFNKDSGERSSFRKPYGGDRSGPKSPKPNTVGGMPHSTVKVGVTEKVEVCFTTSPLDFYVQLSNTFEELTQLMDKIATGCDGGEISDMTDVAEKLGCLAKYSEDDSWYRAVVLEKSFDSVKVHFVDYGNEENVALDKIKTLSEDMSTLPVQAIKCRLLGVPETADTEAFKTLAEGKPLTAQFVARNFIAKSFEIVLVDEETNTNINVVMGATEESVQSSLSKMGSLAPNALSCPPGTTLTCQMTWYVNPSQFYLQPMTSNPEFRAMMQAMQAVVRTGKVKEISDLNVGDFVIARFKADKVLYRALVMETGFDAKVQYVDYGNVENVDSGNVWVMEEEYATLPIQAISCCLAGVQPTGEAWPSANSTQLESHFEAETLDCTMVKELEGGDPRYLVKLMKQSEDVAESMIKAGLAVAGPDAVGAPSELDTSLIVGQTLPVTLIQVQGDHTLYVQPASEDVELLSLEVEGGKGVKCVLSNVKTAVTDEEREALTQLPADTYVIILVDAVQSEGLQVTLFDGEGKLLSLQENEVQSVAKVCPMPVLNMHQKVWIAHASEDGIFLHKVSLADHLAEFLQKLYEFYNESEPVEQEWTVEDLCCAKSVSDEQWYRARLLEIKEEAKVQYIDYGNSEVVPVSNLRQLDASFYTPHAFALPVALYVTWTVPMENLMELAAETEYNAVVLRSKAGWLVELVDSSGQSLTDKLVELGFAEALDNSPFKRIVEGGRFAEGSSIPVSVSFIDSPLQVWIHVGDDFELIEALQDRLQEVAPKLLPLKEPTGIFAAKFSDGLWYRALKLSDSTVRFIDYGNSDVVDMTDLKALSPDFLEHAEGYAVKVELPAEDFKEEAKKKLEDFLTPQTNDEEEAEVIEVIACIYSVKENSIVADIVKGGKSAVDMLVEENLATKKQKILSGFISNLNTPNDFFIQEVGCDESLESVVNALSVADTFEPVSAVNENDLIAALFTDDGLWYRAKVTKQSEDGVEVLFIDYGNSSIASEFRTLPQELAEKPALAKHCALHLEGIEEWTESAKERFSEISAEGCTQFDIKVISEGDPAVVILHYNGNCVNEELKTICDSYVTETAKIECSTTDLIGYDQHVYISHINSPKDFYVQKEGAETELDALRVELDDVSSFESLEITDSLNVKIFGALFDEDELWYRAKLQSITEDGTTVLFVDYGNSAVASKFVKLPETLESKVPVALHCSLGEENWSEEAVKCFVELGGEGTVPFSMKVLEDSDPKIVSLAHEGTIVEQMLSSYNIATPINEKTVNDPASDPSSKEMSASNDKEKLIKTVFFIHGNSPDDFYLQTAEATQLLAEISERLVDAEEFPQLEEDSISKGKIVAAQFDEDDLWYRAKITDYSESETKVIFIDYGNSAKVAKVKELPQDLLMTPALAMNCALVKPGDGEWDDSACETFNKLANEDGVSFDLMIVSEGERNSVSLYINGESVAEQLILASSMPPVVEASVTGENLDLEAEEGTAKYEETSTELVNDNSTTLVDDNSTTLVDEEKNETTIHEAKCPTVDKEDISSTLVDEEKNTITDSENNIAEIMKDVLVNSFHDKMNETSKDEKTSTTLVDEEKNTTMDAQDNNAEIMKDVLVNSFHEKMNETSKDEKTSTTLVDEEKNTTMDAPDNNAEIKKDVIVNLLNKEINETSQIDTQEKVDHVISEAVESSHKQLMAEDLVEDLVNSVPCSNVDSSSKVPVEKNEVIGETIKAANVVESDQPISTPNGVASLEK